MQDTHIDRKIGVRTEKQEFSIGCSKENLPFIFMVQLLTKMRANLINNEDNVRHNNEPQWIKRTFVNDNL